MTHGHLNVKCRKDLINNIYIYIYSTVCVNLIVYYIKDKISVQICTEWKASRCEIIGLFYSSHIQIGHGLMNTILHSPANTTETL